MSFVYIYTVENGDRDSCKKRNGGVPQKKNKSCSYAASLRLRGSSMSVLPRQA